MNRPCRNCIDKYKILIYLAIVVTINGSKIMWIKNISWYSLHLQLYVYSQAGLVETKQIHGNYSEYFSYLTSHKKMDGSSNLGRSWAGLTLQGNLNI